MKSLKVEKLFYNCVNRVANSVFCFIPPFSPGPNPVTVDEDQGTPWMSCQLIAGPLLMAEAAPQVPAAYQEQFWGPVSCSRILQHVALFHPMITSPPALPTEWFQLQSCKCQQKKKNIYIYTCVCVCVYSLHFLTLSCDLVRTTDMSLDLPSPLPDATLTNRKMKRRKLEALKSHRSTAQSCTCCSSSSATA